MVETGHNLLMDLNAVTKCLIVHIQTGLLAVSFYLLVGGPGNSINNISGIQLFVIFNFAEIWWVNLVVYWYKKDIRKFLVVTYIFSFF